MVTFGHYQPAPTLHIWKHELWLVFSHEYASAEADESITCILCGAYYEV